VSGSEGWASDGAFDYGQTGQRVPLAFSASVRVDWSNAAAVSFVPCDEAGAPAHKAACTSAAVQSLAPAAHMYLLPLAVMWQSFSSGGCSGRGLGRLKGPFLVAVLVYVLLPDEIGVWSTALLLLAAAALLFLASGGAIRIGRALGLVQPASPRLSAVLDMAAARVGTRPFAAYEIDLGQPNGVALPLVGLLLVSRDALAILDDEELASLCAHELGHLSESRAVSLARLLPVLLLLALAALPALVHAWGWLHAAIALLATYLVLTLIKRLARRMEKRADRVAVAKESEPGVFARTLEKLHEFSLVPAVMSGKKAIHPHLYDRLLAAGVTPSYPRPKQPSQVLLRLTLLGVIVATVMAVLAILDASALARVIPPDNETSVEWRLALLPQTAWDLSNLARLRAASGDNDSAIAFTQAATQLARRSPYYPVHLAVYLGRAGRCSEAQDALAMAAQRCTQGCNWSTPALAGAVELARRACPSSLVSPTDD
jgi:Zn-dependent protease with chaperone function